MAAVNIGTLRPDDFAFDHGNNYLDTNTVQVSVYSIS